MNNHKPHTTAWYEAKRVELLTKSLEVRALHVVIDLQTQLLKVERLSKAGDIHGAFITLFNITSKVAIFIRDAISESKIQTDKTKAVIKQCNKFLNEQNN